MTTTCHVEPLTDSYEFTGKRVSNFYTHIRILCIHGVQCTVYNVLQSTIPTACYVATSLYVVPYTTRGRGLVMNFSKAAFGPPRTLRCSKICSTIFIHKCCESVVDICKTVVGNRNVEM